MISQNHRFKGQKNIMAIYRQGSQVRGQWLGVKYRTTSANSHWRAAVVVSRKISPKAVVRNRIRRRLYEALRKSTPPVPPGLDLVITVYNDQLAQAPNEKLVSEIKQVLKKLQPTPTVN